MTTRVPLTDHLSVEASAERIADFRDAAQNATILAAGARYDERDQDFNVRYELRLARTAKVVLTAGGVFTMADDLYGSITFDYLRDDTAPHARGLRTSVAGAYRGDAWSVLTRHTAEFGLLAGGGATLGGDTRLDVALGHGLDARAGWIYRYRAEAGLQQMLAAGVTAHPWHGGSVTGYARVLHDARARTLAPGLSLEVAQHLGCGLHGVAGINALGAHDLPNGATFVRPGIYLRADVAFDERWRCGRTTEEGEAR